MARIGLAWLGSAWRNKKVRNLAKLRKVHVHQHERGLLLLNTKITPFVHFSLLSALGCKKLYTNQMEAGEIIICTKTDVRIARKFGVDERLLFIQHEQSENKCTL